MKGKIFRSMLVLAFVLSLIAVPLSGAVVAQENPGICLAPESGSSETAVTVAGQGFTSGTEVKVYFDDELVTTGQADSIGNFAVSFSTPERSSGNYSVKAIDTQNLTASADFGVRSEIDLSHDEGHVGTTMRISGAGFAGQGYITVYYDDDRVDTARTGCHGNFFARFAVPESEVGRHKVLAIDDEGNEDEATFRVTPEINIDDNSGVVGTKVELEGTGFEGQDHITIYYDDDKVDTARTDRYGSFVTRFSIPESTHGRHEVLAVDDEDNEAEAAFKVIPLIDIDCDSGVVGTEAEIEGTGFGGRRYITIYYDGEELDEVKTDRHGSFSAMVTIPESTVGEHRVKVVDTNSIRAKTDFTVIPEISLHWDSGIVGTEVKIEGTGFKGRDYVTIYYDGEQLDTNPASVRTDYYGSFTATVTIPESQVGEHKIKAVDARSVRAKVDFSVTPEISLDLSFGAVGEKVTIRGTGFKESSAITIYYDSQSLNTNSPWITSDHHGSFTATFTVPKGLHGQHMVVGTDTKGNSDESTFTVESIPPLAPSPSSPVPGAETTSHTPIFDWSDVTDPSGVSYTLQVATNPQFSSLLLSKEGLTHSQYALTDGEALGRGTYYWRVKAVDGASNESSWSVAWSFDIVLLPTWALMTVIIGSVALVAGTICYLLLRRRGTPRQGESRA